MPLNLSTRKAPRERWPLEFDLTGVPRDTATRKNLLETRKQEESMAPAVRTITENHFTVDQPSSDIFITDINNPPKRPYNPRDPQNEFPKLLYHHGSGRVLKIEAGPERKTGERRPETGLQTDALAGVRLFEGKPQLRHRCQSCGATRRRNHERGRAGGARRGDAAG